MNIQIFGKAKCYDSRKAERYFKERKIKYQYVDLAKFGLSKGEYTSVKNAIGKVSKLIDEKSKEYKNLFIEYLADPNDAEAKLIDNPGLFKTPIVRNGRKATVGYQPEKWAEWINASSN